MKSDYLLRIVFILLVVSVSSSMAYAKEEPYYHSKKAYSSAYHTKIPDSLFHDLRILGFNTGCDSTWMSYNYDGIEEHGIPDPELEESVCSLIEVLPTNYQDSFMVFDYSMYPPLSFIDRTQAHDFAFQCMVDKVENEYAPPYYLLIGKQINPEGGSVEFRIELKLPRGGAFSAMNDLLEEGFANAVKQAVEAYHKEWGGLSLLSSAEITGIEELTRLLDELLGGSWSGGITTDLLNLSGFYEIQIDTSNNVNIQNSSNQSLGDPNVKDYAGYSTYSELSGTYVSISDECKSAINTFDTENNVSVTVIMTDNDNYSSGGNNDFQKASNQFTNSGGDLVFWLHVYQDSTERPRFFYKYEINITETEADALMNDRYEEIITSSGSGGPAKPGAGPPVRNTCPNFYVSQDWRARDNLLDCIATMEIWDSSTPVEARELLGGVLCGLTDGVMETLHFIFEVSSGINESFKHVPWPTNRSWWIRVFVKIYNQGSFWKAIKANFGEDYEYWSDVFSAIEGFIYFIWDNPGIVFSAILDELKSWLNNVTFQNGVLEAGYTYGKLIFEIVLNYLTGGSGAMADLTKSSTKLFLQVSEKGVAPLLNQAWKKANNAKKSICRLFLGGCFIEGTQVWTASGRFPIQALNPRHSLLPVATFPVLPPVITSQK